jgi:tetratricopeptide (TPR) repeat protein
MSQQPPDTETLKDRLASAERDGAVFEKLRVLEQLCESQPENPEWSIRRGMSEFDLGRIDDAIATFEACRLRGHQNPDLLLNLGHAYSAAGQTESAQRLYRELLERPERAVVFAAYWSLADLKGYRFSDSELRDMRSLARRPAGRGAQRYVLMFALGNALHQRGVHGGAFQALYEANEAIASARPFPGDAYRHLARSLESVASVPQGSRRVFAPKPIFIIGMPRSGSTLVERILASHRSVTAGGELPFIENTARSLDRQGGYANRLPGLLPEQCESAAKIYLEQAAPFIEGSTACFTDKWPNNFWYVGLIRALFPEAPIVNVVRGPLDNSMGQFRQYFSHGNEQSSRIGWIADYWEIYLDVMDQWERLLPGEILHFSYEGLVSEPESRIRRLLDHCGLEFEEQVLRFHETRGTVMTPSGSQVRQPIYNQAVGSAQPYRPFLTEWLDRLSQLNQRANELTKEGGTPT